MLFFWRTTTMALISITKFYKIIVSTLVCYWLVIFGTLDCYWFIFGTPTRPECSPVNVYNTPVFRGCHSFSDIFMAYIMLNHRDHRYYYNLVVGMQNTSDESNEATSRPIERVPSRPSADRRIETLSTSTPWSGRG